MEAWSGLNLFPLLHPLLAGWLFVSGLERPHFSQINSSDPFIDYSRVFFPLQSSPGDLLLYFHTWSLLCFSSTLFCSWSRSLFSLYSCLIYLPTWAITIIIIIISVDPVDDWRLWRRNEASIVRENNWSGDDERNSFFIGSVRSLSPYSWILAGQYIIQSSSAAASQPERISRLNWMLEWSGKSHYSSRTKTKKKKRCSGWMLACTWASVCNSSSSVDDALLPVVVVDWSYS